MSDETIIRLFNEAEEYPIDLRLAAMFFIKGFTEETFAKRMRKLKRERWPLAVNIQNHLRDFARLRKDNPTAALPMGLVIAQSKL